MTYTVHDRTAVPLTRYAAHDPQSGASPVARLGVLPPKDPAMSLSRIRRLVDPAHRAHAAAVYLRAREAKADAELAEIRAVRDDAGWAMLNLVDETGKHLYRPADVARTLGISRAAVAQRFRRQQAS